jgi:beta-aspartyl-peptidase (threonine type)
MTSSRSVTESWGATVQGPCVLVHGGAGTRAPGELEGEIAGCELAARAAAEILRQGGSALNAVQRAVEVLEDDPRFNAGTGGALTERGDLELDASIMDGRDLRAGAVCCLPPYRHPIAVARAALDDGRHVLYAGAGADELARRAGFTPAEPSTMITARAKDQLARALALREKSAGGNTVGAVARDAQGHLAAATSTGGIVGKRNGRVGDSPILGAGTYADDRSGAASATGAGEAIMRVTLCARVVASLGSGLDAQAAAGEALAMLGERTGSTAGLIVVSSRGQLGLARSTASMPWCAVLNDRAVSNG